MGRALSITVKGPEDPTSTLYVGNYLIVSEHPEGAGHDSYVSFTSSGVLRTFPLSWVKKIEIW